MKLFNTLSQEKEEFKPISDQKVGYYTCGPTVYDSAHIGNLRTYIFEDLLKQVLKCNDYDVTQVMNLTDVDDKTIKRGEGNKKKFQELTQKYEKNFFADLDRLRIEKPEVITRATEYIDQMVAFVEGLIEKGFAYKSNDGSVYFSIEKFENYGKLSRLDKEGIKVGARVNQDEYSKENPADFVLWKAWSEPDGEIFWDPSTSLGARTSLGKGRPGWHIECSAMSKDALGDSIDIHAGAVDLIFPHHENEIAQSEALNGKKFVNYWVHGEHLLVDNKKMSKSLDNFYTLSDIEKKGYSPLDFKYLVLGAHYRSKLNFTWVGMEAAKNARSRLMRIIKEIDRTTGIIDEKYYKRFIDKLSDDLGSSEALAVLWELVRDENVEDSKKGATLQKMDQIFKIGLFDKEESEVPQEILDLAEERKKARENKDFKKSDELREQILKMGFHIEDLPDNEFRISK